MLRRSFSLLETGNVVSWNVKKNFGFVTIGNGDNAPTVFVHQKSIIQARNQRPLHSIRRGTQIQFDVVKDDQGRNTAKNVTAVGGKTLSNRDEIPSTTVDVRSLSNKLVDRDDDSRHGQSLRGIVQSIQTITKMQKRTDTVNRNILRLLNAIAEKDGVTEILSGEKYTEVKKVVLANQIRETEERRAAQKAKGGEADDDDDEEDTTEPVEEKKKAAEGKKGKENSAVEEDKKKEKEYHSADDLLDLMEDEEVETTKKTKGGKKSKKN